MPSPLLEVLDLPAENRILTVSSVFACVAVKSVKNFTYTVSTCFDFFFKTFDKIYHYMYVGSLPSHNLSLHFLFKIFLATVPTVYDLPEGLSLSDSIFLF